MEGTGKNIRIIILCGIVLVVSLVTLYGCATIMQGSSQRVGIQSKPTGAMVFIDNKDYGLTPVIAKLSRKKDHMVQLSLRGYEPFEATITRGTNSWVWGNIVIGGLIGLASDAMSGAMYKLKPDQMTGELEKQGMAEKLSGDDILITIVMQPDPSWEKIGNLTPIIE